MMDIDDLHDTYMYEGMTVGECDVAVEMRAVFSIVIHS